VTIMEIDHIKDLSHIASFAARSHAELYRKDKKTPGIVHPARVVSLAAYFGHGPVIQSGSWMHDTVEDCKVSFKDIYELLKTTSFSNQDKLRIFTCVVAMTEKERPNTPRCIRKDEYIRQLISCDDAVIVKICDIIDNITDLDGIEEEYILSHTIPEYSHFIDIIGTYNNIHKYNVEYYKLKEIMASLKEEYNYEE